MLLKANDRRMRYFSFFLLALAINVIDGRLTHSIASPQPRMLVATAASFDVVVMVTLIYYWLLVRPGIRMHWTLIPVVLAGVLHATYLYPNAVIERAIVTGLCELGLTGFVAVRVRRLIRGHSAIGHADPVDAVQTALAPVIPIPMIANLFALELSVWYYALFSWRAKPHVPAGAMPFSVHRRGCQADLLFALAIATLVEVLPMHLLLSHWSTIAAWIVTSLSLYGAVWLIGIARSIELRPLVVTADYVDLRYGLLFRLRIPHSIIRQVSRIEQNEAKSSMVLPPRGEPNFSIELAEPMDAEALFRTRKRVTRIGVAVDEAAGFARVLKDLINLA